MCLQWCHVREWLINNDEPCTFCERSKDWPHGDEACYTCRHMRTTSGQPAWCALSSMPLPKRRTCCHWNVDIVTGGVRTLTEQDMSPGLLAASGASSVHELFLDFDSSPETNNTERGAVVNVGNLAIPDVYGTPSYDWFDAFDEE